MGTGLAHGVVVVGCYECLWFPDYARKNPPKHLVEQGVAEVNAFVPRLMGEVVDVRVLELCHPQVLVAGVHRGARKWERLGVTVGDDEKKG